VYDDLPNEQLDGDFDTIFASGYSVSVFTDLRRNQLWCKQLAADPAPPPEWFGARAAGGPPHRVPGMPVQNATEQRGVPGPCAAAAAPLPRGAHTERRRRVANRVPAAAVARCSRTARRARATRRDYSCAADLRDPDGGSRRADADAIAARAR